MSFSFCNSQFGNGRIIHNYQEKLFASLFKRKRCGEQNENEKKILRIYSLKSISIIHNLLNRITVGIATVWSHIH